MTPQLLVPNPKITRHLYCKSGVKIRFPVYSGWCTDGAFRVVREHHKQEQSLEKIISNNDRWFKFCDKGDDTPAPSPESKNYATFILQVRS
nr:unnamed protein product [Callosobruchus analis]